MDLFFSTVSIVLLVNMGFIIALIFFERKDPTATWAWLLILTLLPVIGFILYLFLGLTPRKRSIFNRKQKEDASRIKTYPGIKDELVINPEDQLEENMIELALRTQPSAVVGFNDIKVFADSRKKFASLFKDLRKAKHHIHINYYIIRNDRLGKGLKAERV